MSDLFERVRDTIAPIAQNINFNDMPDGFYPVVEEIAYAAIAEVRAFDVERGPSDKEVTEAYQAWAAKMAGQSDIHPMGPSIRAMCRAAARVRQEEAE